MLNRIKRVLNNFKENRDYRSWLRSGKPVPPPHAVKRKVIKGFSRRHRLDVFIETGTYLGEMLDGVKDVFSEIHSIELSEKLYEQAAPKFKKHHHIFLHHGDSAEVLPVVLRRVTKSCLFWFDAHYSAGVTGRGSKETPIMEELGCVFQHSITTHVLLIDDARLFIGENDYPAIDSLRSFVKSRYPGHIFEVMEDIIRIYPEPRGPDYRRC